MKIKKKLMKNTANSELETRKQPSCKSNKIIFLMEKKN